MRDNLNEIWIQPIDESLFAPFGFVFDPIGDRGRRNNFGIIENLREDVPINLAQVQADDLTQIVVLELGMLERHPYSSQSFFPQDVGAYLVVVCGNGSDDRPALSTLRAFRVPGTVGISYRPNVWHAGISVLEEGRNFLMVIHEDGSVGDCEFVEIPLVRVCIKPDGR